MKRRQLISKIAVLSILTPLLFSPKSVGAVTISEGKSMIERAVRRYADHYEYDGYAYMFSYMSEYRKYGHAWTATYYESNTDNFWTDPYPYDVGGYLYNPDPTMNAQGKRLIGYESNFGFRSIRNVWSNDSEYKGLHDNHGHSPNTHVDYERLFKTTYRRYKTSPRHNDVLIMGSQYVNRNDYWVKPNTTLNIKVGGYQDYPGDGGLVLDDCINRNYLRLDGGSGNDARICYNFSTKKEDNFQPNDEIPMSYIHGSEWSSSDGKAKSAEFYITPKKDDKDYEIKTYFSSANGKTTSDYYNTGKYIKTDGRAPKWDDIEVNDSNYRKPIVTVKGVRDVRGEGTKERAGSGLDKQYLRVKAEGKNSYVDIYEKERTKVKTENGIDYYDLIFEIDYDSEEIRDIIPSGYGKVIAQFNSYDKVGNYAQEDNIEINDFDVSATIERVLSPHEPIFMGGEKGVLKIKLQGGVERVKITFPQALSKLDSNLNTEMVLTPKDEENIDYEFFIPLEAVSGNYSVTVEAFKGEEKKVSQPALQVKGKITDKLRTRIRLPE